MKVGDIFLALGFDEDASLDQNRAKFEQAMGNIQDKAKETAETLKKTKLKIGGDGRGGLSDLVKGGAGFGSGGLLGGLLGAKFFSQMPRARKSFSKLRSVIVGGLSTIGKFGGIGGVLGLSGVLASLNTLQKRINVLKGTFGGTELFPQAKGKSKFLRSELGVANAEMMLSNTFKELVARGVPKQDSLKMSDEFLKISKDISASTGKSIDEVMGAIMQAFPSADGGIGDVTNIGTMLGKDISKLSKRFEIFQRHTLSATNREGRAKATYDFLKKDLDLFEKQGFYEQNKTLGDSLNQLTIAFVDGTNKLSSKFGFVGEKIDGLTEFIQKLTDGKLGLGGIVKGVMKYNPLSHSLSSVSDAIEKGVSGVQQKRFEDKYLKGKTWLNDLPHPNMTPAPKLNQTNTININIPVSNPNAKPEAIATEVEKKVKAALNDYGKQFTHNNDFSRIG